jgi:hypothetical protein
MITVCAWCQRLLGADPPDRLLISHGMCAPCQAAARGRNGPVLVVRREHADLVPELERLLRETAIPIVTDRRLAQRRQSDEAAPDGERRQRPDRRQRTDLVMY